MNALVKDRISPTFSKLRAAALVLRPHQWLKNLLLFVPIIMAHRLADVALLCSIGIAFIAFSLMASAGYILNDLLDVDRDRKHERKCLRPIASGALVRIEAYLLLMTTFGLGLSLAALLSRFYAMIVLGYFVLSCVYSLYFKRIAIGDVLLLGLLYTWRVLAGAVAGDIPLSAWLLTLSVFIFFSLALAKRVTELAALASDSRGEVPGRGYQKEDLAQLRIFGTSSSYMAILVFALYINSDTVKTLYHYPELLWLILPVLLYWISRIWLLSHRGKLTSDPILFAMRDWVSYLCAALAMVLLFSAKG